MTQADHTVTYLRPGAVRLAGLLMILVLSGVTAFFLTTEPGSVRDSIRISGYLVSLIVVPVAAYLPFRIFRLTTPPRAALRLAEQLIHITTPFGDRSYPRRGLVLEERAKSFRFVSGGQSLVVRHSSLSCDDLARLTLYLQSWIDEERT